MVNQTRQLARLLGGKGSDVTLILVNLPYRPARIVDIGGVRVPLESLPRAELPGPKSDRVFSKCTHGHSVAHR